MLDNLNNALEAADHLGYPVMLKSTARGGGIGLTRCADAGELTAAYETVQRLAQNFFKDRGVFLERCVDDARHVEVQIFGDGRGKVGPWASAIARFSGAIRKWSRRRPPPIFPPAIRARLLEAAPKLGAAVATVPRARSSSSMTERAMRFYFLEVNTRLQVEHPVTEAVLGSISSNG